MDYFPGQTLEQFIEAHGPLSPAELPGVAVPIARGMQAAHGQGVLHRDLKPANVLVRKEGGRWEVKVIDFGLAMRQQSIETSIAARSAGSTIVGDSVAGTLKYAPPEQLGELRGVPPGPYSDVYAFGKLCCYALFKTTEPTRRQWSAIPAELADVLDRCVEQDLHYRHPDFGPVLQVLEAPPGATEKEGDEGARKGRGPQGRKRQTPAGPVTPQPAGPPHERLEAFYKEFKDRHGIRPRAAQALHEGHDPRAVRARHGSWLEFVGEMGDLSEGQRELLQERGDFLRTLEVTPMAKSFKMLTVQAMLNRKALPGSVGIEELAAEFRRLAAGSKVLLAEVGEDVDDAGRLCRYLERNPVAAWAGGKGTGRKGTWKEVNASWCVDPADEAAHLVVTDNILDPEGVYEAMCLTGLLGHGPERGVVAILRDIFGPLLFRPVAIDASWLSWGNCTVSRLARAAYDGRQMPAGTLEQERLGVLADAMEEAGAGDQEMLGHLRESGKVHYRGCWVIDLLLGKS
jgi:hypothetical protein